MGIIILPLLLGALIIGIIASAKTFKLWLDESIGIKELVFGLIITTILLVLILLIYILEGKAWGLSPIFRISIFMVFIPFAIYFAP